MARITNYELLSEGSQHQITHTTLARKINLLIIITPHEMAPIRHYLCQPHYRYSSPLLPLRCSGYERRSEDAVILLLHQSMETMLLRSTVRLMKGVMMTQVSLQFLNCSNSLSIRTFQDLATKSRRRSIF